MGDETDWIDVVQTAARTLGNLDEHGRLKTLDSFAVIDFVVELETLGKLEIPSEALRAATFASVESVAKMLSELKRA